MARVQNSHLFYDYVSYGSTTSAQAIDVRVGKKRKCVLVTKKIAGFDYRSFTAVRRNQLQAGYNWICQENHYQDLGICTPAKCKC